LRPRRFVGGRQPDGSYGVLWLTPRATEMTEPDWNFPEGRFLSYALGPLEPGKPPLYIVLNAAPQIIEFLLPTLPDCSRWTLHLNTAAPEQKDQPFEQGSKWQAAARSVLVFSGIP
jgi:glycogen operon protein